MDTESSIIALECFDYLEPLISSQLSEWYSRYVSLQKQNSTRWAQRAHMDWLNNGDHNTTFFHNTIRLRSHYNSITQILDTNGNYVTDWSDIENKFLSFYSNLWTDSSDTNLLDIYNALPNDLPTLSDTEGLNLIRDLTREELYANVCELPSGKAPGPNGFNAEFYHYFWSNIGEHFFNAIRYFFSNSVLPASWSKTFIALIPKVNNPRFVLTFIPYLSAMSILKLFLRSFLIVSKSFFPTSLAMNKLVLSLVVAPSITSLPYKRLFIL